MKNIIVAAILYLFCQAVMAAGWTGDLNVTSAFTEDSDFIVVNTSGGSTYTSGCTANVWVFIGSTDARRAREYATVLAAIAAGKSIRFWYTDTCGIWGYHQAHSVMIVN